MTGETSEQPTIENRRPGDFSNYEQQEDGAYNCKDCGATILAATVTHPIHLAMMPGAGFGEVQTTQEPYCPNCETQPNPNGAPVYYSF